jgi:hypothetical protein
MATAGHAAPEATLALVSEREKLDAFSLAALALALHEVGGDQDALQILELLESEVIRSGDQSYWPGTKEDSDYNRRTMASSTRTTAMVLSAFVELQMDHSMQPSIVRWLMNQRTSHGWGNTNETSYVILALTDYLLANGERSESTEFSIMINGVEIAQGVLGPDNPTAEIEVQASQLKANINSLIIQQTGSGWLYYTFRARVLMAQEESKRAGEIRISRTYYKAHSGRVLEEPEVGDLVRVELEVKMPREGSFMIVEDRLPGGLEALNESLANTSRDAFFDPNHSAYRWRSLGYNYKEVRADRVSFFITEVSQGKLTLSYLARVVSEGEFTALPTEAWAMYDDTLWGRSASSSFGVLP